MTNVAAIADLIRGALGDTRGEILLVVPPLAAADHPSIGAHLLAALGEREGARVDILYANMVLAAIVGIETYHALEAAPYHLMLGDRIFADAAFDVDAVEYLFAHYEELDTDHSTEWRSRALLEREAEVRGVAAVAKALSTAIAEVVAERYAVVGVSTTFHQTAAAHAILRAVKARAPEVVTLLGGNNCCAEMAEPQRALAGARADYVFSGECERAWPEFLRAWRKRDLPSASIIHGEQCRDLDALPAVDYASWYAQRARLVGDAGAQTLTVLSESSRGCWWGVKHHCTFCGQGETLAWRQKQPQTVLSDLRALLAVHPSGRVLMTDSILPSNFFDSLLPQMAEQLPRHAQIFYEVKSNLTLKRCRQLAAARVTMIQPGIEALSTSLLARMKKGVTAIQNLNLLRYARAVGIDVSWNLLYGFPGDGERDYAEQLSLVELIAHLQPPAGPFRLSIDRFSPYHMKPEAHGITEVRPLRGYEGIYPTHADVAGLAYHFDGTYESFSASRPPVVHALQRATETWRARWRSPVRPELTIRELAGDMFLVRDTRGLEGAPELLFIERPQAAALLGAPASPEIQDWAIAAKLAARIDGRFAPLPVAAPALFASFQREASPPPRRSSDLVTLRTAK